MSARTTGSAIRLRREAAGLTQGQLGSAVGVGQATVSDWERGAYYPRISQLKRVASACNCKVRDLLLDGVDEGCAD